MSEDADSQQPPVRAALSLSLHEQAAASFDRRGEALLAGLEPLEEDLAEDALAGFPDPHIAREFGPDDVLGFPRLARTDAAGIESERYFLQEGGGLVGLRGQAYADFAKLRQSIQRTKALAESVEEEFVGDAIFRWLQLRAAGSVDVPLTAYVLAQCEGEIRDLEAWVPVASLMLQEEVTIGRVTLKPMGEGILRGWEEQAVANAPDHAELIRQRFQQERKELQGFAVGLLRIRAARDRAEAVAREETRQAVSLLRLFHPAALDPRLDCHCAVFGERPVGTFKTFVTESDDFCGFTEAANVRNPGTWWPVRPSEVAAFKQAGLNSIQRLLTTTGRTSFQDVLLKSLHLYSTSIAQPVLGDRLVYLFSALESLLVKDSNESLQASVADRIAFFLANGPEERREIVKAYKAVYALRSRFVHHGETIEEVETVGLLLEKIHGFFFRLLNRQDEFATKEDLIEAMERVKYSSPWPDSR